MDEEMYVNIVMTYQDMLYRLALHDCKNCHDAEDVVQTVFLNLYRTSPDFESMEHLKNWLIRVTINECRKLFVSPWKKKMDFPNEFPDIAVTGFENPGEQTMLLQLVFSLPRKYRIPIYLYYYEEYSVKEISSLMGKRPSTIQTQLARARGKLKQLLKEVEENAGSFSKRTI